MTNRKELSKYTKGKKNAEKAKKELRLILSDENNPFFLAKDTELAECYGVTRLTIYNIRTKILGIPPRSERIIQKLKHMKTDKFTITELSDILKVKYQNLYKIIVEEDIPVKNDIRPIECMIKFQKTRKKEREEKT
jgi:hypothetical protein